jgi:hypothetical protein
MAGEGQLGGIESFHNDIKVSLMVSRIMGDLKPKCNPDDLCAIARQATLYSMGKIPEEDLPRAHPSLRETIEKLRAGCNGPREIPLVLKELAIVIREGQRLQY